MITVRIKRIEKIKILTVKERDITIFAEAKRIGRVIMSPNRVINGADMLSGFHPYLKLPRDMKKDTGIMKKAETIPARIDIVTRSNDKFTKLKLSPPKTDKFMELASIDARKPVIILKDSSRNVDDTRFSEYSVVSSNFGSILPVWRYELILELREA
jgi:hypothetical protein